MNKRLGVLNGFLLMAMAVVACGGCGSKEKVLPPSASMPAAELQVTDQREIEIEGGRIAALSPNGEWLVVSTEEELCIYETESMTEQSCVESDAAPGHLDLENVAWSPDSTRIAFTEHAFKYLLESDLRVLDVDSSKLNNLTDDGVTGSFIKPQSEGADFMLDLAPAWSPDGERLVFSRSIYTPDGWGETALYTIPASGGVPEKLLHITDGKGPIVWGSLRWSAGRKILCTVVTSDEGDPETGVWIVGQDGQDPRQLAGMTDPGVGPPMLVDVSEQGEKALILYWKLSLLRPNVSRFALIDLKTGDVEPLKKTTGQGIEFRSVENAAFSPDGSKVIYTYTDASRESRLVVRDLEGESEHVLLVSQSGLGLDLYWAENDTIYVGTGLGSGLLLSLD